MSDYEPEPKVTDMYICEIAHLVLHTGQLYRFSIDPNCAGCLSYDGEMTYQEAKEQLKARPRFRCSGS